MFGSSQRSPSPTVGDDKRAEKEERTDTQWEQAVPEDKVAEAEEHKKDAFGWNEDPANPRLWPASKKWAAVAIVSMYTFVSPLASSMMAPALPQIGQVFHITSPTILGLTLSIFILAYALGPLVLGPLSEIYGRTWVLHISNLVFVAFTLGCAFVKTTAGLIICRFLAGLGGSAPLAIGAGSISDLFDERSRANAMAIFSLGPLVGPVLGPIAGGFIANSIGYKWIFRILTIVGGLASVVGIPLLRETYAPVIIARRHKADILADPEKFAQDAPVKPLTRGESWIILRTNLVRPIVLLFTSLVCFTLSLYMALIYGFLYLMFVTFPTLFSEVYGWNAGVAGLAYLGPGLGFFVSTLAAGQITTYIYSYLSARNNGVGKPEFRIPPMLIGSLLVPIGLFWYGWSAQARIHWIMPIIGSGIFGAGMMMTFLPSQLYLIDSFQYAASAVAAATVFRSLFGFAFPLFGEQMFAKLGNGGGNSLLAGLAIVIGIPFPIFFYLYGERLRSNSRHGT